MRKYIATSMEDQQQRRGPFHPLQIPLGLALPVDLVDLRAATHTTTRDININTKKYNNVYHIGIYPGNGIRPILLPVRINDCGNFGLQDVQFSIIEIKRSLPVELDACKYL